jgi:hypothetical protein
MRKCPFCAGQIQDEAIVCRFCHYDLRETPAQNDRRAQLALIEETKCENERLRQKRDAESPLSQAGRGLRFAWELFWLVLGVLFIIFGLTGQSEGGAGASVFSVILGVCLVGWGYWRWQANRLKRP